ncbi:unnamed protein product [Heterotrigona itama]|uniref:Uncharacterized protein n=1 Tax=Heterotrigona itama TaxID=395501 RepID=A0A6V7HKU9_9HYME|nr:unnamed protein product [Heterotrigona itama]
MHDDSCGRIKSIELYLQISAVKKLNVFAATSDRGTYTEAYVHANEDLPRRNETSKICQVMPNMFYCRVLQHNLLSEPQMVKNPSTVPTRRKSRNANYTK